MKKSKLFFATTLFILLLTIAVIVLAPENCVYPKGEFRTDAKKGILTEPEVSMPQYNLTQNNTLKSVAVQAFILCNNERKANNLSVLSWDNSLEAAALIRAYESSNTWSHTRPNGSEWWTVNSGIMFGENLAKGYKTADEAVKAWMHSKSHKGNILFSDYKTSAIAIYELNGTWYWAEEFGY